MDFTRATELTPEIEAAVVDAFQYHAPSDEQIGRMKNVREVLCSAVKVLIANVPLCADRSVAIRKIMEARMDSNQAICLQPPVAPVGTLSAPFKDTHSMLSCINQDIMKDENGGAR